MYASNEDEFPGEHDDWVFLRRTPPATTLLGHAVNLVDHEQTNSSSSTNSSKSSGSSSSKSERSDSSSSLSSNEREHIQNDEQGNHSINEDPVLPSQNNDDTPDLATTGELKEDALPLDIMIKQCNENETTPVINEYDLITNGQDVSQEPVEEPETNLRRRTGANVQHSTEEHSITADHERSPPTTSSNRPKINDVLATYLSIVLIFVTLLFLGQMVISQQSMINQLNKQLEKTNEQLRNIQQLPMEKIEQKLTDQFEHRLDTFSQQMKSQYQREKSSFIVQIRELNQRLNLLQANLTDQIHQLANENRQLQEQMMLFKQQLKTIEEHRSTESNSCPEGADCKQSTTLTMDVLLSHLLKQTASLAEDTSVNLSGLFEQLSASLSDLVDHGQEYVEESKRKLTDLAGSPTAEHVQTTFRRGVENLSSSLRQAQSSYVTWLRKRAQEREQARTSQVKEEGNVNRGPWRWTFRRSQDRAQMRHQTPITKKHTDKKDYVCQSNCRFPVNHICTMRNWMEKLFHP